MMRWKRATPEDRIASFEWCLGEALQGDYPSTETGLNPKTIRALRDVANAAAEHKPTDELVKKARGALEVELYGKEVYG
jgi:hypothetical protein